METKKSQQWALVCINENAEVVSVETFGTENAASARMRDEFGRELDDVDEDDVEHWDLSWNWAEIKYGSDLFYKWQIKEVKNN